MLSRPSSKELRVAYTVPTSKHLRLHKTCHSAVQAVPDLNETLASETIGLSCPGASRVCTQKIQKPWPQYPEGATSSTTAS